MDVLGTTLPSPWVLFPILELHGVQMPIGREKLNVSCELRCDPVSKIRILLL